MTNYASVLGCETTYPVWEERSAHRCRYLSFDLLPYLKAGENVLAVRLGNGWYHQTERIAEGKFVFGLPKLWFELTLTDADGRQEWIESDRQTLWHPGGLLKNNLFLGEVRDLRKEPEGWQDPDADLSGWKPAQPVHAPETLLEEQTCPPDRVIRKLYPILIGEHDGRKFMTVGKISPGALCFPALEKKENALRYAMQRSWQRMVRWISNRRAAAISCSRIIISATEGYRHCIRCFVGMAFVILRRRVHVRCCVQR